MLANSDIKLAKLLLTLGLSCSVVKDVCYICLKDLPVSGQLSDNIPISKIAKDFHSCRDRWSEIMIDDITFA